MCIQFIFIRSDHQCVSIAPRPSLTPWTCPLFLQYIIEGGFQQKRTLSLPHISHVYPPHFPHLPVQAHIHKPSVAHLTSTHQPQHHKYPGFPSTQCQIVVSASLVAHVLGHLELCILSSVLLFAYIYPISPCLQGHCVSMSCIWDKPTGLNVPMYQNLLMFKSLCHTFLLPSAFCPLSPPISHLTSCTACKITACDLICVA